MKLARRASCTLAMLLLAGYTRAANLSTPTPDLFPRSTPPLPPRCALRSSTPARGGRFPFRCAGNSSSGGPCSDPTREVSPVVHASVTCLARLRTSTRTRALALPHSCSVNLSPSLSLSLPPPSSPSSPPSSALLNITRI